MKQKKSWLYTYLCKAAGYVYITKTHTPLGYMFLNQKTKEPELWYNAGKVKTGYLWRGMNMWRVGNPY